MSFSLRRPARQTHRNTPRAQYSGRRALAARAGEEEPPLLELDRVLVHAHQPERLVAGERAAGLRQRAGTGIGGSEDANFLGRLRIVVADRGTSAAHHAE